MNFKISLPLRIQGSFLPKKIVSYAVTPYFFSTLLKPECVLGLSVAARRIVWPSGELFSIQGISVLQTEAWTIFPPLSSLPLAKRTWVEPLSCLLVQKLACSLSSTGGETAVADWLVPK